MSLCLVLTVRSVNICCKDTRVKSTGKTGWDRRIGIALSENGVYIPMAGLEHAMDWMTTLVVRFGDLLERRKMPASSGLHMPESRPGLARILSYVVDLSFVTVLSFVTGGVTLDGLTGLDGLDDEY
jgi:hypothetical protein